MASTKKKTDSKNTLQKVAEEQLARTPSQYDYNKVLFSWEANDRPVYTLTNASKISYSGALLLFGLYFWWVGQPVLTLVAAAVFFTLMVVLNVPPQKVTHTIERMGVRTLGKLYSWEDMTDFWVAERENTMMLYINTRLTFPPKLIFIVENFQDAVSIVKLLAQRKSYRYMAKAQGSLEKYLEGKYVDPIIFFGDELERQMKKLDEKE